MSNQLFKSVVPLQLLFDLLDKICEKQSNHYLVDLHSYKKMLFHNYHEDFCEEMMKYYHSSKQFYITRKLTYNSFTNILRQICKLHNIGFTYYVKYSDYKYNIVYNIFFNSSLSPKSK
jgi:hypothetical protein